MRWSDFSKKYSIINAKVVKDNKASGLKFQDDYCSLAQATVSASASEKRKIIHFLPLSSRKTVPISSLISSLSPHSGSGIERSAPRKPPLPCLKSTTSNFWHCDLGGPECKGLMVDGERPLQMQYF